MRAFLFVHDSTALGGAEKVALAMMSHIRSMGHPVYFLTCKKEALWDEFVKISDGQYVTAFPYPRKLKSWVHAVPFFYRVKRWMLGLAKEWIIISVDSYSLWAALLLKTRDCVVHSMWQGEMVPHLIKKWKRYGALRADQLWASWPIVKFIEAKGGMGKPVHVLNPRVDLHQFNPSFFDKMALRHAFGFSVDAKLAICVGRIGEAKGQRWLAEGFLKHEGLKNWFLLLVGPINEGREVLMKLKTQDQGNRLRIFENRQDVAVLLAMCDLAIFPGTCAESFGLSMVEALLMDLPVLATKTGAFPYLLPGYDGLVSVDERDKMFSLWEKADFRDLKLSQSGKNHLRAILDLNCWLSSINELIAYRR
jgi:glycosyltransferase involved in cell wall biosynthesis